MQREHKTRPDELFPPRQLPIEGCGCVSAASSPSRPALAGRPRAPQGLMLQHRERSPWLNRAAGIPGAQTRTPATGGARFCPQEHSRGAASTEVAGLNAGNALGTPGGAPLPCPRAGSQALPAPRRTGCPPEGRSTAAPGASTPTARSPVPGTATHPLPRKAARPRRGGVREELVQPGLPLLLHAVAGGDRQQVNAQLVQRVAQQLPVVVDGVRGAAGRGDARGALGQGEAPGPTAAAPPEPCPSGSCPPSSSPPARTRSRR